MDDLTDTLRILTTGIDVSHQNFFFFHAQEFHLYDKVGSTEDTVLLAQSLAQLQSLKRVTLSEANEDACKHLGKILEF